jgi:hypothetical protein
MKIEKTSSAPGRHWPFAAGLIGILLIILFFKSFLPGYVHFSNDGPLGQQNTSWSQLPYAFTGMWNDMNYIGINAGAFSPSISPLIKWLLGPIGYIKFYAPIALFILGFGAWTFFSQLRLSRTAAVLGALAVMLNSTYFSTACWGVASQQIAVGFDFMALALVVSLRPEMSLWVRWPRIVLAGMAIGVNVMEAADIGAMLSMFMAAIVFYHAFVATEGSAAVKLFRGASRVGVIAVSAMFIAAFALSSLIGTQIKGVAGTAQDTRTKEQKWDWATQWSFPKRETLTLIMPGIFGYLMNPNDMDPRESQYWGVSGRDPSWWRYFESGKQGTPHGFLRQSGGGCYAGVTAVLIALWAAFQAFRGTVGQRFQPVPQDKQSSPAREQGRQDARPTNIFTPTERKLIWFFVVSVVVSLLLAYGRYAPFFWFVYQIPYVSTIRNPGKFLHIFTFALTVLTAFGIHGLCRGYMETTLTNVNGLSARLKGWWNKASAFDKRWTIGCLIAIGVSIAGWLVYAGSKSSVIAYLQENGFDEEMAPRIAGYSIAQIGWYLLFLVLGVGMITLILSGAFAGRRAKLGGILLGVLLVADLVQVDRHWIKFVDYKEKYATNAIIEFLRNKPYEHRVAILPFGVPPEFQRGLELINNMYGIEWAQHHFQYFNIQSLDVVQMPRMPADLETFETGISNAAGNPGAYQLRRWELTNTRYLIGLTGFLDVLNSQLDSAKHRFRIAQTFDINLKPGVEQFHRRLEELTAILNPQGKGQFAIFEFTGALPRAKVYSHWQISTNDEATLAQIGSTNFDAWQTVFVAEPIPSATTSTNSPDSSAEFVSYSPKNIKLKVKSAAPSVLLLNDKYDPNWRVLVDDKEAPLLRCNYIMRGVYLPTPGEHMVEFQFKPDVRTLYVSVAAIGIGLALLALVGLQARTKREEKL